MALSVISLCEFFLQLPPKKITLKIVCFIFLLLILVYMTYIQQTCCIASLDTYIQI